VAGIAGRDRGGLPAHRIDRPERPPHEQPRHADDQEKRERAADRERRSEPAERLLLVVERGPDDEDGPVRGRDRQDPRGDDLAFDRDGAPFGEGGKGDVGGRERRLPRDAS